PSTPARCPPVETATVSTVPAGAVKPTVARQGVFSPPAGIPPACPSTPRFSARTWICRLSSTPVIRPPTLSGELTVDPYAGVVRLSRLSRLPTTSQGASAPAPIRARCSTATVTGRPLGLSYPTPTHACRPVAEKLATLSISV